jgi:hypothetical protein
MKRITERFSDGTPFIPNWFKQLNGKGYESKIAEKLAEYEDLEERGLLLKLPCKIGDTIYYIRELQDGRDTKVIENDTVRGFAITPLTTYMIISYGHRLSVANFGKYIFLDMKTAENALNEIKREEEKKCQ